MVEQTQNDDIFIVKFGYFDTNNVFQEYTNQDRDTYVSHEYQVKVNNAVARWKEVLSYLPDNIDPVILNIDFKNDGANGTLGASWIDTYQTTNTYKFGFTFPFEGTFQLNTYYHVSYYTILHEIGHILGIGTLWHLTDGPLRYVGENTTNYYYQGENALREYKRYYEIKGGDPDDIYYIPIEDDGGAGTAGGHAEEGELVDNNGNHISTNERMIDNTIHPGLGSELMTGWSNGGNELSRITIGFLQDIGWNVDYSKADDYSLEIRIES